MLNNVYCPSAFFFVAKNVRDGAKKIAANLEVRPYGMLTVIIMEVYAGLKDEEILVVILQNGISARHIVKVVGLERLRNPRHMHVVDVKEVESVRAMSSVVLPMISPCTRKDTSVKLRTVLEVIAEEKLRLEIQLFLEALVRKGAMMRGTSAWSPHYTPQNPCSDSRQDLRWPRKLHAAGY